jgi:hypothetical protein
MTYPTTFGTISDAQQLGPTGIAAYSSNAALQSEQGKFPAGTCVVVTNAATGCQLYIASYVNCTTGTALTSTINAAYGGGTIYWWPLGAHT